MNKSYSKVTDVAKPSREEFHNALEALCRAKIGKVIEAVLECEVDAFLERVRAAGPTRSSGYRDGHDAARAVTYGSHPVTIRRPRVRKSSEAFVSEVLPPYRRRFEEVDKTLHELWIQGLSTRDFEPSLRGLLGETTPLSPSMI